MGRQVTREGRFRVIEGDPKSGHGYKIGDEVIFESFYEGMGGGLNVIRRGLRQIMDWSEVEPLDGLAVLIKQLAICAGEG